MLQALDEIIQGLGDIKNKVSSNQHLENEDWIKVAAPLRETIELFINSEHLSDE